MKRILHKLLVYFNILAAFALILSYFAAWIPPEKFWLPAFFGLAFPYILILNIILAIYWLIRWKKTAFISLIVILAGLNHINNYMPFLSSKRKLGTEDANGFEIKVLSYNVRAFNLYDWLNDPNTNKGIFNFIRSEHPDIVCLQEFYTGKEADYHPDKISRLFRETPYQHISYSYKSGVNTGYGIATFSKYPIIRRGSINFENSGNQSIFTDILFREDTIRIYNNHLQSLNFKKNNYAFLDSLKLKYSEKQMRELQDISGKIKKAFIMRGQQSEKVSAHREKFPGPVVVCGDFNDTPVSYTYHTMKRGLYDAFVKAGSGIGTTYLGRPPFRIDYILYSGEFSATEFEKVEAKLSDHYPIMARLKR